MMISTVKLVDIDIKPIGDDGDELLVLESGTPAIKGNFLLNNGKISLVSPEAETLVIAVPFDKDGEVYLHFAFGTENRRICHTITVDGLQTIVTNLQNMLSLARLESNMRKDR